MLDYYKNTPLPIYNAFFYNNLEYYVDISKSMDYITTEDDQHYNLASVIDMDINKMNSYSSLFFINTLNNVDILIEQLEIFEDNLNKKCITELKSFNTFLNQLENVLKKIDNIFATVLVYEIRSQFFKQTNELELLNLSLEKALASTLPYKQEYIEILNNDIEETKNYTQMIQLILSRTIILLRNAHEYINFYYEIETIKADFLDKNSIKFLSHSIFNFCIPKHYIRFCIINNNKLIESMDAWSYAKVNQKLTSSFFDNKIHHVEVYEIHSISDYINVSLNHLLKNYNSLKKCYNCNKYFIPESRTDEIYCNNKSPQNLNKTCKEYGAKKTYRDAIKSTPIKYEHNKTSQFYRMRINRAKTQKEKKSYEKQFANYKETYQKKKEQYQSGKLKEDVFVKWIEKQKKIE